MGYSEVPPIPKYVPTTNGYEDTFSDYENRIKGEYPFQLYTPKYIRSRHAHFDNISWLREAFVRPVFISTQDAQEKGISDMDTVRVYNNNGSVLRPACVTNRIMPGIVGLPHGGEIRVDETTGYNFAGSANWLTYPTSTGHGCDGYNSQICNFEKYSGEALELDCFWPNRNPQLQLED
jgi:anaerobic dimethyl sulfoxide reductase subunit A